VTFPSAESAEPSAGEQPAATDPSTADPSTAEAPLVLKGRVDPGPTDWVYVPIEVPSGVSEIAVRYAYDRPDPPPGLHGNALDIGIFDERGHDVRPGVGVPEGFRGWSGGARDSFAISATEATPGYLPGPVNPGTWHLLLGPYTVAPQGLAYRVEVTLRRGAPGPAFVPSHAPQRAAGRGRTWYRGDLHMHTVHSDGELLPEQLAAAAREAGLDFIVSSEHNTPAAAGIWGRHAPEDLLIIDGEEVTTRNGHFVAAGLEPGSWIDWRFRARDDVLRGTLTELHRRGGIAIAAHPFAPCLGCAWKFAFDAFDAVEVWNGAWTPDDEMSLRQWDGGLVAQGPDRWLPAVGSSDFHGGDDRLGQGQTVVLADDLTRDAILDAVRAGRSYLTESATIELEFSASAGSTTAGIGDRLAVPSDAEVTVALTVRGVPGGVVGFVTDQGTLTQYPLPESGEGTATWTTTARASSYVRAEVRRPTPGPLPFAPMAAFTNPIFLGRG